jgi:putative membrane-bound dehydrogenase-like protein
MTLLYALLLISRPLQAQDPYSEFIASSKPRTPAEEQKCFHLPPGFVIELVAAEPAIIKPINMNFDDRGRLWVTQSVEYPFPATGDRQPRDTVKILESTNGDGILDKVTTFADKLNIPIGVLPLDKGALVYSIPNIYGLYDTNGTDHADKREILYSSYGHRDTHGMTGSFTWGFDGWVYACHGYSNTSIIKAKDGSSIEMNSGNTYRFRADGSHVEQFTHGQVNPFGLTFDPLGNLYSADCHTRPIMMASGMPRTCATTTTVRPPSPASSTTQPINSLLSFASTSSWAMWSPIASTTIDWKSTDPRSRQSSSPIF